MPNEQEIMDAAIILYSLQCLSSVVHFGGDVQKYVVSSEERDLPVDRKNIYIQPEYEVVRNSDRCIACRVCERQCANLVHSFDAETGKMQADSSLCVNCHRRSPRRSAVCKWALVVVAT